MPGNEPELVDMFKRWSIAYSKVLMCHLREEGDVETELQVGHSLHCSLAQWYSHLLQQIRLPVHHVNPGQIQCQRLRSLDILAYLSASPDG